MRLMNWLQVESQSNYFLNKFFPIILGHFCMTDFLCFLFSYQFLCNSVFFFLKLSDFDTNPKLFVNLEIFFDFYYYLSDFNGEERRRIERREKGERGEEYKG